jgi:hypothetical protein
MWNLRFSQQCRRFKVFQQTIPCQLVQSNQCFGQTAVSIILIRGAAQIKWVSYIQKVDRDSEPMGKWTCAVGKAACGTCITVKQGEKDERTGKMWRSQESLRCIGRKVYIHARHVMEKGDVAGAEKDQDAVLCTLMGGLPMFLFWVYKGSHNLINIIPYAHKNLYLNSSSHYCTFNTQGLLPTLIKNQSSVWLSLSENLGFSWPHTGRTDTVRDRFTGFSNHQRGSKSGYFPVLHPYKLSHIHRILAMHDIKCAGLQPTISTFLCPVRNNLGLKIPKLPNVSNYLPADMMSCPRGLETSRSYHMHWCNQCHNNEHAFGLPSMGFFVSCPDGSSSPVISDCNATDLMTKLRFSITGSVKTSFMPITQMSIP